MFRALQRIKRLSKIGEINKLELNSCLYSRAMLNSLAAVLPQKTHRNCEMTECGLDFKNPTGMEAYNICLVKLHTLSSSIPSLDLSGSRYCLA